MKKFLLIFGIVIIFLATGVMGELTQYCNAAGEDGNNAGGSMGISFTANANYNIDTFTTQFKITGGSGSGTIQGQIYSYLAGKPNTLLKTCSGTINAASFTTSWLDYNITGCNYNVTSGTQYFLVWTSASSNIRQNVNTSNPCSGGDGAYYTSSWQTWGNVDFYYRIYGKRIYFNTINISQTSPNKTSILDCNFYIENQSINNITITWFQNISGVVTQNSSYDKIFLNTYFGKTTSSFGSFLGIKKIRDSYLCQMSGNGFAQNSSWVTVNETGIVSTNGLIRAWVFNNTIDSTGNSNLTNNAGVTFPQGKRDNGALFSASNSYFTSASVIPDKTNNLTISVWVKPINMVFNTNGVNLYCVYSEMSDGNTEFNLEFYNTTVPIFYFYTAQSGVTKNIQVNITFLSQPSAWHHIVMRRWSNDTGEIWIDGVLSASGTNVADVTTTNKARIGGRSWDSSTGCYFGNNMIDELYIWNRSLTNDEISTLSQGLGNANFYPFLSSIPTINPSSINKSTPISCNFNIDYESDVNITWYQNISGVVAQNTSYDASYSNTASINSFFNGSKPGMSQYLCQATTNRGSFNSSWITVSKTLRDVSPSYVWDMTYNMTDKLGTFNITPVVAANSIDGINGKALSFTGTQYYLKDQDISADVFSFNIWIYRTAAVSAYENVFSTTNRDAKNTDFHMYFDYGAAYYGSGKLNFYCTIPSGCTGEVCNNRVGMQKLLPINAWSMITVTINTTAGVGKIYYNGVLENTSVSYNVGDMCNMSRGLVIGRYTTSANFLNNAYLDEFYLWKDYILTDDDVKSLYLNGKGEFYPLIGSVQIPQTSINVTTPLSCNISLPNISNVSITWYQKINGIETRNTSYDYDFNNTMNIMTSASSGSFIGKKQYGQYLCQATINGVSVNSSWVQVNDLFYQLMLYYKLDETNMTVGANIVDSAGHANATISTSSPSSVTGKISNGINFSGVGQGHVNTGNNAYNRITGNFSFSLWVKPIDCSWGSNPYYSRMFGKSDGGSATYDSYYFEHNTNCTVDMVMRTSSAYYYEYSNVAVLYPGQWTHLVGVYTDRVSFKLYANGVEVPVTQQVPAGAIQDVPTRNLMIGRGLSFSPYTAYNGVIDEFMLYNRTLSAEEAVDLFNLGRGQTYSFLPEVLLQTPSNNTLTQNTLLSSLLIGKLNKSNVYVKNKNQYNFFLNNSNLLFSSNFDVFKNSSWYNSKLYSVWDMTNNMTDKKGNYNIGSAVLATTVVGKSGTGLNFTGTEWYNNTVALTNATASNFSFNVWYKMPSNPASIDALFASPNRDTTPHQYCALITTAGRASFAYVSGNTEVLSPNVWHMLTFVQDATNSKFYIYLDGYLNVTQTSFNLQTLDKGLYIGTTDTHDRYLHGTIDELYFWKDYALTSDEVYDLYNNGQGTFYNSTLQVNNNYNTGKIGGATKFNGQNSYVKVQQ